MPMNTSCPLVGTTSVCAGPGDQTYQYKVTVAHEVNNIFGGIFGIGKTTVRATGTAEYLKPLQMGSPSNQYGNDPDNTSWPIGNPPPSTYPNFWGNIEGAGTAKQQGDAYAADWCDTSGGNLVTDGCSAAGDGNNNDFKPEGYFYAVDFKSAATVNLQAFDPAFVHVGQLCQDSPAVNLTGAAALANIPSYPEGATNTADIQKRFQGVTDPNVPSDPGLQYCTGDNNFPNSAGNNVAPATTYKVLKAMVPGDPSSAQQVCAPITYPGYSGDVSVPLAAGTTLPGAPAAFATYFRQWVTLCSVSGQPGDEYFIQVSTDNGAGSNHFSLRGVTSGNSAGPVTIAGNTYMGIYANVGSAQRTNFYVVRIPTAAKGHILVLNFYDIGDANSQGTLTIVPPTDSNIGGSFPDNACTWTGDSTNGAQGYAPNTPSDPWGPLTGIAGCTIPGVNGGGRWNAQWSTVRIPIPSNYTCNDSDPNGCWITINYLFAGVVHDVTSWNAFLIGAPVRLTK